MPNSPNNLEPINPESSNPESTDPESLPTRQPGSEQSPTIDDQDTGDTSDLTGGYAAQQVELSYSGPLPDPMTMRAYQAVYSKAAQQMFEQFNQETEHRIKMADREFEADRLARIRGQWMAFILGAGCLAVALVLVLTGNGGWAAGVALGPIAILAGTFITNRLKGESAAQ